MRAVGVRMQPITSQPPAKVPFGRRPEHTDYRDTGCEASSSCLRCPLPACRYDGAPGRKPRSPETIIRRVRIVQSHRLGYSAFHIAALERISLRSVYVAIRAAAAEEAA